MNGRIKLVKLCIITGLLLLCSHSVQAATLTVESVIFGTTGVSYTFNGTLRTDQDAGEFKVRYDDDYASHFLPGFCVDLNTPVLYGNNDFNPSDSLLPVQYDPKNGIYAEWLMDSFSYQLGYRGLTGANSRGAALQLAIWEALYDLDSTGSATPFNLDYDSDYGGAAASYTGTDMFYYDRSSVSSDINVWYDYFITQLKEEIDGGFTYTSSGKYLVIDAKNPTTGADTQDILVAVVPEPGSMVLLGFGLLGLSAVGRRKLN